jgi:hypothetical protein
MSMRRTIFILPFLLTTFSAGSLPAQTKTTYPPPTPPLVAPVPENAQWTLTISSGKEVPTAASGEPQPQSPAKDLSEIRVTKTSNLKQDIISSANGNIEVWYADGMLLIADSNRQIRLVDYKAVGAQLGNPLGDPLRSSGYTGVSWLDLKYYDQVVSYHGKTCYHYSIKSQQGTPQASSPTVEGEAWIEVVTRLPVAYTNGDGKLYTYQFSPAPTSPLVLPPPFQAALDDHRKGQDKMERLREAAAAQRHT